MSGVQGLNDELSKSGASSSIRDPPRRTVSSSSSSHHHDAINSDHFQQLQATVEEYENKLRMAGQIGQSLVDRNEYLENKLRLMTAEMDALKADATNHTEELEMMYRRNGEVSSRLQEAQQENLQLNEALATAVPSSLSPNQHHRGSSSTAIHERGGGEQQQIAGAAELVRARAALEQLKEENEGLRERLMEMEMESKAMSHHHPSHQGKAAMPSLTVVDSTNAPPRQQQPQYFQGIEGGAGGGAATLSSSLPFTPRFEVIKLNDGRVFDSPLKIRNTLEAQSTELTELRSQLHQLRVEIEGVVPIDAKSPNVTRSPTAMPIMIKSIPVLTAEIEGLKEREKMLKEQLKDADHRIAELKSRVLEAEARIIPSTLLSPSSPSREGEGVRRRQFKGLLLEEEGGQDGAGVVTVNSSSKGGVGNPPSAGGCVPLFDCCFRRILS